jgi:lactobin A/cerein 7B family class IIb bacteriocin
MDKFKELSFEEMQETQGGLTWLALGGMIVGAALLEALFNPQSTLDAIKSGWDRGGEMEKYMNL